MSEKDNGLKKDWYRTSSDQALEQLGSSTKGLTDKAVELNRDRYGVNVIAKTTGRRWWQIVWGQIKSPLIYILILAAVVSLLMDHLVDFWVITGVIILNAIIGFVQEYKAEQSIAALQSMIVSKARVIRNGELIELATEELAVGDLVVMEGGDQVPADARVVEAHNCQVVESALTGESNAVFKSPETIGDDKAMADQINMVWSGTYVASGNLTAVVTAVGGETVLGQIASSLDQSEEKPSHFKRKASVLAKQMGALAVFGAGVIFVIGIVFSIGELTVGEVFVYALAILVSSIPEGLPAILTIVLAVGARRMASRSVITKHLPAIESIGIVDTIVTDKTGTLTQNTMTVQEVVLARGSRLLVTGEGWRPAGEFFLDDQRFDPAGDIDLMKLLDIGLWGTGARVIEKEQDELAQVIGDPTEAALVVLGAKGGLAKDSAEAEQRKLEDWPFDQLARYRGALVNFEQKRQIYVVGSPDRLLDMSRFIIKNGVEEVLTPEERERIDQSVEDLSSKALRVIALAYRSVPETASHFDDSEVGDLVLVGVVGMKDPARAGVKEAILRSNQAGIRVVMCTGDHKKTALAIAGEVGLLDPALSQSEAESLGYSQVELEKMDQEQFAEAVAQAVVFARVTPDMKKKIAEELQRQGHLIAMTGDGVNDVPALNQADVGIAMGRIGTDLARESSDIVLVDDNFVSIVNAVEEGRNIFRNVRSSSGFLVTTSVAENFTIIGSIAMFLPLPLMPTQILWLNLVTDGIAGVPLALEPKRGDVMKESPRSRKEQILSKQVIAFVLFNGLIMTTIALSVFLYFLEDTAKAQTAVFTVLAFSQLFNVLNMRSLVQSIGTVGLFTNRYVIWGIAFSALAQLAVLQVPLLQDLLHFVSLSALEFITLIFLASIVLVTGEIYKLFYRRLVSAVG